MILLFSAVSSANPDAAQKVFASPEDARQALVAAVKSRDHQALESIFGPLISELEPSDPQEQAAELEFFAENILERNELVKEGDDKVSLIIGDEKWPFPVPIVKKGGSWVFDTAAGRDEIITRRIGHNEELAQKVCRAYVQAQREYYNLAEPDGEQIPKYAQKLISSAGRRDGLYWPSTSKQQESPLGPLVAKAKEGGYLMQNSSAANGSHPFHGYYFKILKKQGSSAPGGRFSYIINSNMVAGHALVAYPAKWGNSGVMTFIVNQRGRVYQKNLGPNTLKLARQMKEYNPDQTWKLVGE
jgi:hypothetical protein